MTSQLNHIEPSQRLHKARLLAAIVVPPVLLVILLTFATVGLKRHLTDSQAAGTEAWDPVNRNRVYDETTSKQQSVDTQELILAAKALESRFDGLDDGLTSRLDVRATYDSLSAEQSIIDVYAAESAPVLESLGKIAASETPVWLARETPFSQHRVVMAKLLQVARFEYYAALRSKDDQRALSALAMIPALSKNLNYAAAFDQYYWFTFSRDAHRMMVTASLETGFWTDAEQLDAIAAQLDEFDSMGSDRAGLPEPWRDMPLPDVDRQTRVTPKKLSLDSRLVVAVFGPSVISVPSPRAESIRNADASQRFVRTAIAIKKYQLMNSEFPRGLSDLQSLGFSSLDFEFVDGRTFKYAGDANGPGELHMAVEKGETNDRNIFFYPRHVVIR